MNKLLATGIAVAAFAVSATSEAARLDFSYSFSAGNTVSGVLDGTLAPDGNLFTITGIDSIAFNAVDLDASNFTIRSSYQNLYR